MISLIQKQNMILMYHREGQSQREIHRQTGIDRRTISKYIKKYEEQRKELACSEKGPDQTELIEAIVEVPKYTVGVRPKRKMTEAIQQKIQAYLSENEEKRKKGQRKQQKKPMDIFEALEAEGVEISYSTVLRTIRSLERKTKEAYIKGEYLPGDICEFDWGEVKVTIGGKLRTLQMAVFTSAFGNYRFACLFTKQTTECFQEAHAKFFEYIGGVYQTMVYDNMKVAVKRFVGTEKEPTEGLLKLSLYYGFKYRFCNIRSGNEKGHVERSVEVVRRKVFAFKDTFETLEDANLYVLGVCGKRNEKPQNGHKGQSANKRLEQERPYLLPALPMFDAARVVHLRVDKYATVVVDQNHYSVPDHLVGETVMVKIYATRIQCFYQETQMAEHARLTGNHEWVLALEHYVSTLKKKPGALASSLALQQAQTKIKTIYENYYIRREKDFIELIQYIQNGFTLKEIERGIEELCRIHPSHVTTDKIKVLCARNREVIPPLPALSKKDQEIADRAKQHLKMYDDLFHTRSLTIEEVSV